MGVKQRLRREWKSFRPDIYCMTLDSLGQKRKGMEIWYYVFKCKTAWGTRCTWVLLKMNEHAAAAAKLHQSCPILCHPTDGSPPGSPIPGILQARTLELVAISFSNAWKWKVKVKSLSHVRLFATPWTAAYQAPPFMGFSRQEYWSELPLPSPEWTWKQIKTQILAFPPEILVVQMWDGVPAFAFSLVPKGH